MTKKGLTLDEHRKLGKELQDMSNRLTALSVMLANAYPKGWGLGHGLSQATRDIFKARDKLDSLIFRDFPELDELDKKHVYFPPREGDQ